MPKISSTAKTVLIASAFLLTLCFGWFFLLYQPKVSKMETIKEETQNIIFKLQSLRVTEEQVASLEKQVELLKRQTKLTQNKIMTKDDLQAAIAAMRKIGRRFGLKFDKIIPDYPSLIGSNDAKQSNPEVLKLIIHFKMQGYYMNFGKFLSSLDKLPFYVSLGEMTLVYNPLIHPEIDILLDAVVYLRTNSAVRS
ncbi:MAG: hypothetical protein ACE5G1_04585 [bacterium]